VHTGSQTVTVFTVLWYLGRHSLSAMVARALPVKTHIHKPHESSQAP